MVYRVLAPQAYSIDLGVVGYIDHGQDFLQAVNDVIKGLAPFSLEVNPINFTPEALFDSAYDGLVLSAKSKVPVHWPASQRSQLKEFLAKVLREHRQWKFRSKFDEGEVNDHIFHELEPVAEICQEMNKGNFDVVDGIVSFTISRFAQDLSQIIFNEFGDTLEMFTKAHRHRIKAIRVKVDAGRLDTAMLDMKMLIEVEEGENDS